MEPSDFDPSDPDPSDFVRRWESYLARTGLGAKFSLTRLPSGDGRIPAAASRFLTEAGLPSAAGLRFGHLAAGLRPVYERYGRPDDWTEPDRRRLAPFLVLGSDEGGNPVCLDTGDRGERVVFLDHEGGFARGRFVNSGVAQLAECVLAFQEMVEEYQSEHGEEAELYEGDVPPALVARTLERFRRIDPAAAEEGGFCFWPDGLEEI